MDNTIRSFVLALIAQGRAHDSTDVPHANKTLNLEIDTAELLRLLIRISGARHVLEVGTSTGVSTIFLADVLASVKGSLTSIERDGEKRDQASANLASVGFSQHVTLLLGDATEVIRDLSGPFDAVFFDADRVSAPAQVGLLLPKLTRPALLLADNALSHPQEIGPYLDTVRTIQGADTYIVPVGKGLSITYLPL